MQLLTKLFGSPARLKLIRLFVFNKGLALSVAEIASRSKLLAGVVRKELAVLLGAGLVRKKRVGVSVAYQIDARFSHLPALEVFIRDTTQVSPARMVTALRKTGALRLVVLSGLFLDTNESQIDLLVVGDRLNERALSIAVHAFEAEMGREIRYASFHTEDFRYRMGVYDRLLRDVFDYPHRLLVDKIGL